MKTFTIGTNEANQRFDKYLKKLLPNASVSFLYKMLRKKNITLDGKKATGKETLQKGAQVAVFSVMKLCINLCRTPKNCRKSFICCSVCK